MSSGTPQKATAPMVYISHSRRDAHIAQNLARALESGGIKVVLDYYDLSVGDNFQEVLRSAIENSDFMIVLMSSDYFKSRWCQAELSLGLAANKRLLPVLLEGQPQGPMSYIQYIDASNDSPSRLANELVELVRGSHG